MRMIEPLKPWNRITKLWYVISTSRIMKPLSNVWSHCTVFIHWNMQKKSGKCDLFTNRFNVPKLTGIFVEEPCSP